MPAKRPNPREPSRPLLELDDPAQSASGAGNPRPTVRPKFDPQQYAEDSEVRERMPTVTDEAALEQARLMSMVSLAPPPPSLMGPRDSHPDIDVSESDIDALGPEEQVAILRARLAPLARVPVLALTANGRDGGLEDPKAAYVTGFVDGVLPLETIIDVTGLPELDTLRVLDRLAAQGLVSFR